MTCCYVIVVQVLKSFPDTAENKIEELEGVSPEWLLLLLSVFTHK